MTTPHGDSKLINAIECLKRVLHCICFVVLFSIIARHLGHSFTAVYPGGVWNLQIATLGDDPQEVDLAKAKALCNR